MFSPDNFYNVFRSWYSWPKTHNVLMVFTPHGSRSCMDLSDWLDGDDKAVFHQMTTSDMFAVGRTIMHDQEPVLFYFLNNTYKEEMLSLEKNLDYRDFVEKASPGQIFASEIATARVPIFCHSEINSGEIRELSQHLFVPCYYWWHGMIARDWFRHWEHYPELVPSNKASAQHRFLLYARGQDGTRLYRKQLIRSLYDYRQSIKYHWDHECEATSEYSAKISIDDAMDSAIHIVAETIFHDNKIHLTEKVFKPMVMSQPFFLFSGPGSLQYLRDYGFKTFGNFWDESYDLDTDHRSRFLKIVNEIKKLCDMPADQFHALYQSILPIIQHNRERFFSVDFQDHLLREMHTNYARATTIQQDLDLANPGGQWFHMLDNLSRAGITIPLPFKKKTLSVLESDRLPNIDSVKKRFKHLISSW